ncbi:hypothetical protein JTE90_027428 [Oedothorax gibbosus]|uniref:Uncharacterized protein n=1 Tax=Oedothorax gibbosus TaxID=931172 RepID=A0AAV6W254_9ARAC|nr:hypothetical protein JTE90_027428 [Oedothorax gibbosus]
MPHRPYLCRFLKDQVIDDPFPLSSNQPAHNSHLIKNFSLKSLGALGEGGSRCRTSPGFGPKTTLPTRHLSHAVIKGAPSSRLTMANYAPLKHKHQIAKSDYRSQRGG